MRDFKELDFKELEVWQKAHRIALDIYEISRGFPREERFGLTSQMRRSAISVPSNIAEGCGRGTRGEFAHFVSISTGSTSELEYRVLLARDLSYLSQEKCEQLTSEIQEVKRMSADLLK